MDFIYNVLKGIAIGGGFILPGISSGVICVIFGIYEKIVNSILNIFKDFKNSFIFLFPLFLGACIGIYFFGNVLNFLLLRFEVEFKFITSGIVIASIPSVIQKANKEHNKSRCLLFSITSFLISLSTILLALNCNFFIHIDHTNFIFLVISGFFMSFGVVIPGVSSTVILMILGIYNMYLSSISNINFTTLFPLGIGLLIGCIFLLKIINYLFKNHFAETIYIITGFIISSIFILIYNNFYLNNLIFIIIGLFISLILSHIIKQFTSK